MSNSKAIKIDCQLLLDNSSNTNSFKDELYNLFDKYGLVKDDTFVTINNTPNRVQVKSYSELERYLSTTMFILPDIVVFDSRIRYSITALLTLGIIVRSVNSDFETYITNTIIAQALNKKKTTITIMVNMFLHKGWIKKEMVPNKDGLKVRKIIVNKEIFGC